MESRNMLRKTELGPRVCLHRSLCLDEIINVKFIPIHLIRRKFGTISK